MRFIITTFLLLAGLMTISQAKAESDQREYCMNFAIAQSNMMEVTTDVTITGNPLTDGDWTIAKDTITITFDGGRPMVWNPATVSRNRKMALMDWIWTAKNFQKESGLAPFAARDQIGQVYLFSQYYSSDGKPSCLGHRLDMGYSA